MITMEERKAAVFQIQSLGFIAMGDRVVVEEDKFRSGYECRTCDGEEKVSCPKCDGRGVSTVGGVCKVCDGSKQTVCPACNGKGASIVVPQNAQMRPTSGTVVSAGKDCAELIEGDRVIYARFAGNIFGLEYDEDGERRKIVLNVLHEKEILSKITGGLAYSKMAQPIVRQ